ncbi:MAG: hypothetical protein F4064_08150 [Acidimicrobiales bacterium]|nr:hypothetical protein [Acidimicrobiales bacterium]
MVATAQPAAAYGGSCEDLGYAGDGRRWASNGGECFTITNTAPSNRMTRCGPDGTVCETGTNPRTDSCINPDDPHGPGISVSGSCPRVFCPGGSQYRTGYDSDNKPIMEGDGRYLVDGCSGGSYDVSQPYVDPCASPPYCQPPAPPSPPPAPAAPSRPAAPTVECSANAARRLIASATFSRPADTQASKYEVKIRWISDARYNLALPAAVLQAIADAEAAVIRSQSAAVRDAAAAAAAELTAARSAVTTAVQEASAAVTDRNAKQTALRTAERQKIRAIGYRTQAAEAADEALASAQAADAAVSSVRTVPSTNSVTDPGAVDAGTLTAEEHADEAQTAAADAQAAADAAETKKDTAEAKAAGTASDQAVAVAAADDSWQHAQDAANASAVADAHADAASTIADAAFQTWSDAAAAVETKQQAFDVAARRELDAVAADAEASAAANTAAFESSLAQLRLLSHPATIALSEPTGSSDTVSSPAITTSDRLAAAVSIRAAARTSASNAYGTTWSAWSQWGAWSQWSYFGTDRGDAWDDVNTNTRRDGAELYTDANGNGQWDSGEPYTDIGNGRWDEGETYTDALNGRWDPGETFVDANSNGAHDRGDPFTDWNNNGVWDHAADVLIDLNGDGLYNGRMINGLWNGDPLLDANRNFNWDGGYIVDATGLTEAEYLALQALWWSRITPEPYHDANRNGIYDAPEPWTDALNGDYDPGEQFVDLGNGQWDSAEPYTDINSNGQWDPPVGCPIPGPPTTPVNTNPCSHDPSLQAATYPAGHAEPYTDSDGNGSYDSGEPYTDINGDGAWTGDLGGYPTGFCFPVTTPPHPCLQPGALCLGTGS